MRVISDTAGEDLPLDFNQFLTADKKLEMSKLMMAVASKPWKMGAMMELQKNTKLAAQRLGEVPKKNNRVVCDPYHYSISTLSTCVSALLNYLF